MDTKKAKILTRISGKQSVRLYDDNGPDKIAMPTQEITEYNTSYDNSGLVLPDTKSNIIDMGKNNRVIFVRADGTKRVLKKIPNGRILFKGSNNRIELHEPLNGMLLNVNITHNVNIKIMGSVRKKRKITIIKFSSSDKPNNKNKIVIGKDISCPYGMKINVARGDGDVTIGENCMFSTDMLIRTGDGHAIFDTITGELVNPNKSVVIGNNVWCGIYVRVLKGAKIPDNCIVGACSVVTKEFTEPNVAIAGNPARIVRRNIRWERPAPIEYQD